ncbi:MAG: arylsulfatase [Opitutaceae bacterium]|nr:arylsulfatase [Opitutaceae bacterium]
MEPTSAPGLRASARRALRVSLALAAGVLAVVGAGQPPARPPNIVFIMADDLGYADLGCYGQTRMRTPRLDRLAAEGTRFTQVYAGASVCAPSRGVLLTGLHLGHARIRANSSHEGRISLTDADQTVAEVLQRSGYATGAIGKWGIGEPGTAGVPNRRGFDEWFGYLNQNHAPFYYTDYLWRNDRKQEIPENAGGRQVTYAHDLFADEAVDFLRRHRNEPFFLYLPFTLPHRRFEVPSLGAYADEDWPEEAKLFAAMVTRLDHDVGRVLDELDRLGLAENTLVFFTSDNGSEKKKTFPGLFGSGGLFRGEKGTLYEGGLRVPMIVRWPGRVPAGAVSGAVWWFPDVFPTLVALGRGQLPGHPLDGLDISPALTGKTQPELETRTLYWEDHDNEFSQAALRGHWKVLRTDTLNSPLALYDLKADPGEQRDVAASHPEIVAEFERFLARSRTVSPHWPDPK